MGYITLRNINYETRWHTEKLKKTLQQELEGMKQEVIGGGNHSSPSTIVSSDALESEGKELQHRHRITRAATAFKKSIWGYGVIPYEIDALYSGAQKSLFKKAMRHWEKFTCIKFVKRERKDHPNYIIFTVKSCG